MMLSGDRQRRNDRRRAGLFRAGLARIGLARAGVLLALACVLALAGLPAAARAETIRLAVATNFLRPLTELARAYEQRSGDRLLLSGGSTGKLYAQIVQGAPFDLFFAADQARPRLLLEAGIGVPGSRFTYAEGRLVLWSADSTLSASDLRQRLQRGTGRIAIANEKLAPYGAAAIETLHALGLWPQAAPRLVRGDNVGQAFALAATGNAPLGLVSASTIAAQAGGSQWLVPALLHAPVQQDVILLKRAADSAAARTFLAELRSPATLAVLERWGYQAAAR